ncbi:T-cell surface glycoprotein CD1b-1-like isoform X7 [Mustela lutreola]|uniref:T-cell surface glycoprotein CD1b-1-like isoform X7 n=1 Tax=Mustela lutreola TaxID=9666 RepID=UPI002796F638|nr:T-cell surface glycoprotein CD1b-1-like isoform X7 [Mustela lutreola]
MLFLQLVLLVVLLPDGDSEDDFQKPICIRIILTTSFYNHSWMQSQGSAWLNELQTHAWNNKTGAFIFLQRWPKDKFCNKELMEVDELFSSYYTGFLLKFHDHGSQWQLELRPEAWLSTGPSPGPGHLLLVCHVSGFYPKPVWVMWMRGEQEQQGTQRGDVLPHADGTWYLQVSLDVKTREAADLLCQVRHSSLGGQDLVLYWEQSHTTALDFLVVIMPLVLLAGLTLWLCRHWKTHWRLQCTGFPFEQDPSSPGSGTYLNPTQQ